MKIGVAHSMLMAGVILKTQIKSCANVDLMNEKWLNMKVLKEQLKT